MKSASLFLLLPLLLWSGCKQTSSREQQSDILQLELNENWFFSSTTHPDYQQPLPAQVPGTVQTDLLSNHKIEEPFYRFNEDSTYWVEREDWTYTNTFKISKEMFESDGLELVFEGLDTYATVKLNAQEVFYAENMHRTWFIKDKSLFREGENTLEITFHSISKVGEERLAKYDHIYPTVAEKAEIGKQTAPVTRKAAYQYGWDWAPRLVAMGIWRPIKLKAWNKAKIEDFHIVQHQVSKEKATFTAEFELETIETLKAELQIHINGIGTVASKTIEIKEGNQQKATVDFEIENPKLWWTNGLGNQHLYEITGIVKSEGVQDVISHKIGVRTLELVQEEDEHGESFKFRLNGKDIFAKGANWVPNDHFLPRVTKQKYVDILEAAKTSNMNIMRVWGGGVYEDDLFYELCDEYGFLVWQDFMFACTQYPADSAFLANIKVEAEQNVKRLRNHPSIALWVGNNEIETGWVPWQWMEKYGFSQVDSTAMEREYEKLFYELLPSVVDELDHDRKYWASSPQAGWGKKYERQAANHHKGDDHFWGVWFGTSPHAVFYGNAGRFVSEYGFQSFPELSSIEQFASQAEGDFGMNSALMDFRQRSFPGNQRMQLIGDYYYQKPKDFESFVYQSQLTQAEGVKLAAEYHRRRPQTMGTIFWQINDSWPTMSWSSIDYYGKWKALQYFMKKAFAPVIASAYNEYGKFGVYVLNDKVEEQKVKVSLSYQTLDGKVLKTKKYDINAKAMASTEVIAEQQNIDAFLESTLDSYNKRDLVLAMEVKQDGKLCYENTFFFNAPKDLNLKEPTYKFNLAKTKDGYELSIKANTTVKNLMLSCNDEKAFFSDNYFDLLAHKAYSIKITTDQTLTKEDIQMMSLVDSFTKAL
ncbi:beta-mannosidase [Sediminitomix flava]|uniref:Beta-mannosidase n=1 Tax=Sediminitomix flava TaxID=379075 RepID=A0A315ZCA6_SEDFL|nr:glycoside hydrolase family 2 protein [Sediminitomix flava]PWJ43161.1 beta-mannosidase [Sediminitomix flava]